MIELEIRPANHADFESIYAFITELENQTFERQQLNTVFLDNLNNRNII